MLFLIIWVVFIVGVVWILKDEWSFGAMMTFAIGLVLNIMSVGVFVFNHIGTDACVAKNYARYNSLVYQYENDIYNNDNDLGKRDLMVDIQKWNEDLSSYRNLQNDLWVGIYIPNVYDQFDFISLDK